MSTPRPLRWWDPRSPMDVVTAVWSAADLLPVRPGTGAAYQALFLALRRVILGRTLTTEVAGKPLRLTVHDVVSVLDPVHLIKGRLDVRVSLSGIRWAHYDFDHAEVVLRSVALRPGAPPLVSATPLDIRLDIPSVTLDALLRDARPGMSAEIDDDGTARVRWARRPGWGDVEVDLALDDGPDPALRITPRALTVAGRRLRVPAGMRDYRLALTHLPPDVQVTDLRCRPGGLRVYGTLPRWRMRG